MLHHWSRDYAIRNFDLGITGLRTVEIYREILTDFPGNKQP